MEIHQYWTVPRQTQRMTTPSYAEKSWLQYNHGRKGSQLESTTSQQKLVQAGGEDVITILQHDLADRRMANPVDPVLSHRTSQERQPAPVPELPNNQPHQSPKQSHAEDHTEQIEATSREDHHRRTGRLQNRKEYHRADLQPTHSM